MSKFLKIRIINSLYKHQNNISLFKDLKLKQTDLKKNQALTIKQNKTKIKN